MHKHTFKSLLFWRSTQFLKTKFLFLLCSGGPWGLEIATLCIRLPEALWRVLSITEQLWQDHMGPELVNSTRLLWILYNLVILGLCLQLFWLHKSLLAWGVYLQYCTCCNYWTLLVIHPLTPHTPPPPVSGQQLQELFNNQPAHELWLTADHRCTLAALMGITRRTTSVPSLPESPWLFITPSISALDAMASGSCILICLFYINLISFLVPQILGCTYFHIFLHSHRYWYF